MHDAFMGKKTLLILALSGLFLTPVSGQEAPDPANPQQRAEALLEECLTAPDPVLVLARAKAARRLFAQAGDPRGEGMSLLMVGSAESYLGEVDAAQAAFEGAAKLLKSSDDAFGVWLVRLAEAEGWRSMGKWEAAIASFQRALEELRHAENNDAEISLELFRYFAPSKMPREMLDQVQPMLALMKPVFLQLMRSTTLVEMAAVEREQGRYEEALRTLDRALNRADFFPALTGQILVEKAEIELALDRPTRAMTLYQAALPVAREQVDLGLQARILRGMAEVRTREGREEEAADYLERAEVLAPGGQENPTCGWRKPMIDLPH